MEDLYRNAAHGIRKVSMLHRYRITAALSGLKIYHGQPEILGYLIKHGDCSQKELADALGVSPASIATSLKRMSKAGFISRSADEKDKRINRLQITDLGKEVFLAGKKECDKVDKLMLSGFSEKEIADFSAMMSRIAENLSGDGVTEEEAIFFLRNSRNGDDKNA